MVSEASSLKDDSSIIMSKLSSHHYLDEFDCGKPSSNDWLKKYARANQSSDSAQVYMATQNNRVVGYYAILASSVATGVASLRAAKGQPKLGSVPAILVGQLAVDVSMHGQGLGKHLLKDALYRCLNAADVIGARVVLVHAIDESARSFYLKYGFEESLAHPLTLMLLIKDIKITVNQGKVSS